MIRRLPFAESTESIMPYLRGRTLSGLLLTVSHFVFAFHFGLMLLGFGRTASVPTFLNPLEPEGSEVHPMKGLQPLFPRHLRHLRFFVVRPDGDAESANRQPQSADG